MHPVLVSAMLMVGLAIVFGTVLALAYRFLKVEEDPRLDTLEEMLPGTNCGACGTPGCRAFAQALIGGDAQPAQCTVSGPDEVASVASFLGVDAGTLERKVARLSCAGGKGFVADQALYQGISSCTGAALVNGGSRACTWGCIGLGDCEAACSFSAISMTPDSLPQVDVDKCTACNDCVEVCPLDLFSLQPLNQPLFVQCNNPLSGEAARLGCKVACDACGKCVSDSDGALEMINGLPRVVPGHQTDVAATYRCASGAIQWLDGKQFSQMDESKSPELKSENAEVLTI